MRALMALRDERAARRETLGTVKLEVERADAPGKLVFEARHVEQVVRGPASGARLLGPRAAR